MKLRNSIPAAMLAAAAWMAVPAFAQLQKQDIVQVVVPYRMIVGEKTLPPGAYTIRELINGGDSRALLISSQDGTSLHTMALITRDVEDLKSPAESKVMLLRLGKNYYLDQVWVEGDPYGYQIVLPESVRDREKEMERVSLPGQ